MALIALRLVHLIETHSDELANSLVNKLQSSSQTHDLRKVPTEELSDRIHELLEHLSEWLLTKSNTDIRHRYLQIGERRAGQGVSVSDYCWAIFTVKEYLWDFLQQQGFLRSPIELYGEMELLRLLDQFFDRAVCYATEGYEQSQAWPAAAEARAGS